MPPNAEGGWMQLDQGLEQDPGMVEYQKQQQHFSMDMHEVDSTSTLCYCIHNAIDSDEEILQAEAGPEAEVEADGQGTANGPSGKTLKHNMSLPTVVVHQVEPPVLGVPQQHRKKKHKKKHRSHSFSSASGTEDRPPPPLIVQEPPTPTDAGEDMNRGSVEEGPSPSGPRSLPLLNLPMINLPGHDHDEDEGGPDPSSYSCGPDVPGLPVPSCQIRIDSSEAGGGREPETAEADRGRQRKRRRKSLVNLLFPPKSPAAEATTPTLEAPQGQRLHFRRVSEIFSRMGGGSHKDDDWPRPNQDDLDTPATPPEHCGLSIRNLFPYRRRRSSVHHLDNTEQFKESREEIMQSTRRRMSSFPPMDGDEAAIMLEKANVIRLEQAHQEALALQNANAVTKAFHRLRRGSRSPSPMSLFPGVSKSKKSKWKSSTDITAVQTDQQPPLSASTLVTSSFNIPGNIAVPSFPVVQGNDPAATTQGEAPIPPSTPTVDCDEPRRPLFVFPKRKIEDVPGIFIPGSSHSGGRRPSKIKTTEDMIELASRTSNNLLAVMKDKPRRHSMSDPVYLQSYAAAQANSRPLLLPRSPYSTEGACGIFRYPSTHVRLTWLSRSFLLFFLPLA